MRKSFGPRIDIGRAKKYIENLRKRRVVSKRDLERNIHDTLRAIDALSEVKSVDVSGVRLMMANLLRIWQGRWYYR